MISLFPNKYRLFTGSRIFLFAFAVLCSACSKHSPSNSQPNSSIGSEGISIGVPALLARAVDVDALVPVLLVNGEDVEVFRNSDNINWSASYQLQRSDLSINLRWFELIGSENLLLASYSREWTNVDADINLVVSDSEYVSRIYDNDGDGFSNLREREMDSDPYDPTDFPNDNQNTDEVQLLESFSFSPAIPATDNPDTVALKFLHASEDAPPYAIFVENSGPLNSTRDGEENQLRFDGEETDSTFGQFEPGGTYQVNLIPDYYTGNRTPAIAIDYSPGVGSVGLIVLRGLVSSDGSDPSRPAFQALAYESDIPGGPNVAKVRVVHAARGMGIVAEGCECTTAELDLYFDVGDNLPLSSTPVTLSYQTPETAYLTVPAGDYAFTATERGNPSNIRFLSFITLEGASVKTIVLKDAPGEPLGTRFKGYLFDDLSFDD